jgi:hypothetical protein
MQNSTGIYDFGFHVYEDSYSALVNSNTIWLLTFW